MTKQESKAFIKTLLFIAEYDNEVTQEELAFLNDLDLKLDLSQDEINSLCKEIENEDETLDTVLSQIDSDNTKEKLLYELISLCYVDGEYSLDEKAGINDIATLLDYSIKKLTKIEKTVQKEASRIKFKNETKELGEKAKSKFSSLMKASKSGVVIASKTVANGSKAIAKPIADGLGTVSSKISFTFESIKKTKQANKELRKRLKHDNISESVKQKVIMNLHEKIKVLTTKLQAEKERNDRNEELIKLLQAQLKDLEDTMTVAENVKAC